MEQHYYIVLYSEIDTADLLFSVFDITDALVRLINACNSWNFQKVHFLLFDLISI